MSARAFVTSLQKRGAVLQVENGRLRVTPAHVLTEDDRRAWKEHRAAIVQVLGASNCSPQSGPASTCRSYKRTILPAATSTQFGTMTATSYAKAELLRRRLVANGVTFRIVQRWGKTTLTEPHLSIRYKHIAPEDYRQLLELRAEFQHMTAGPAPFIAEFEASAEYQRDKKGRPTPTAHKLCSV